MKCMKKEREKRFRTLTKRLRLRLGRKLEWEEVFGEKKWFGSREKREIEIFEFEQNWVRPIKNKSSINLEILRINPEISIKEACIEVLLSFY